MLSALPDSQGGFLALLRRPRYPGFILTVLLSRTSAMMFNVAGVLLVLDRTGSAPLAGATAAAAVLPGALSGPVLGAWLDVARRRRVLIVIDQLTSVVALLAIVALAGHAPNWSVPAVAVLYSITRPFSSGSFFSALTGVVGAARVVDLQAAITLLVAVLIAINPVFEVRPPERAKNVSRALRDGLRELARHQVLRGTAAGSTLASFGWGLMTIAFPLYAARTLHAGAHASGYLWAAVAAGSLLGTFALTGAPSLRRVGISYGVVGLSALAWPLAHTLAVGILLIGLTGFVEGPAYSGTIALRQRHTPPAVRAQVMTTIGGFSLVAMAAGAAIGGAVDQPLPAIVAFTVINAFAALIAAGGQVLADRHRPGA